MRRIAIILVTLLASAPALAADLLVRASSQATASLAFYTLGMKVAPSALFPWPSGMISSGNYPYLQGTSSGGVNWFVVLANGGTGKLYNAGVAYDTGFWATMRWNGDISTLHLPAGLIAYTVNGLAVVATGGDGMATVTDTFNATPQTPAQPPAAVLLTAPSIM